MVNDRESGKPKGFGFCEFETPEVAVSAIRKMNGREIHGRQLRLDSAASERDRDEMFGRMAMPPGGKTTDALTPGFLPLQGFVCCMHPKGVLFYHPTHCVGLAWSWSQCYD